jgi:hypothetical protein
MMTLDSLSAEARQFVQDLQGEVGRLAQVVRTKDQIIELQDQKIRLLNFQLWGPKGETISPAQTAMLFDEPASPPLKLKRKPPCRRRKKRSLRPGRGNTVPAIPDGRSCRNIWSGVK